jgi:uncharacterized surface protein with fasciclin (FAS1) repeats
MLRKLLFIFALFAFVFAGVAATPTAEAAPPGPNIVEVALSVNSQTGEFDTLIAALLAANPAVIETLSGNGQFTVFAPTDAAFAAIGLDETTVGSLPQDALTNILLYHVARGRRDAADVVSSSQIRMLNGGFTHITIDDSGAFINDAQIVATDVPAANGIIHVIDGVLLP